MDGNRQAITVTELNEYVRQLIDGDPALQHVTVKGEISNFVNHYKTGHFYLSLKDEGAAAVPAVKDEVIALCEKYPIYENDIL